MKQFALWVQNRVRSNSAPPIPVSASFGSDIRKGKKITSAITPGNVPEFIIPDRQRKAAVVRTHSDGAVLDDWSDNNNNNCNNSSHQIISGQASSRPISKVASLPSQMYRMDNNDLDCSPTETDFPHLKTKTSSYGFTFVGEVPHTNRKESLFMGTDSLEMLQLQEFQKKYRSFSTDSPSSSVRRAPVERRAASIPIPRTRKDGTTSSHSLPNSLRSHSGLRRQRSLISLGISKRGSDVSDASSDSCSTSQAQLDEDLGLGKLECSLVYHKSRQQLEVNAIRAQDLSSHLKDNECNSYVKVYLEPGKACKQQTDIVRGTRNPTFNKTLIFKNVSEDDLKNKTIRLRTCNKAGSSVSLYSKRSSVGEVVLPLNQLDFESFTKHRICHDLDCVVESQSPGCVCSTVELNIKENQLYVSVVEAANLRPLSPPDTYITVCVSQKGRTMIQKQTQVKKNSSHPSFNEVFAFSIDTSLEKLQSTTISIKVMTKELLRNDVVLGEVLLGGKTSADKQTFWTNLLNVPAKKSDQWTELSSSK